MMETIVIKHRIAELSSIIVFIIITVMLWLIYQNFVVFLLLFSYFLLIGFAHWYVSKISKVKWRIVQYHERLLLMKRDIVKFIFKMI